MSLSNLPDLINQFLAALRSRDEAALSTTLADDVALNVDGLEIVGKIAVRTWFSHEWSRWTRPPRPINDTKRQGTLILTMLISEPSDDTERFVERDWSLIVRDGDISSLRSELRPVLDLPHPLRAYVKATNTSDIDGLVAIFHEDAIVNDQLQVYRGQSAIREWAAREIIGTNLTMHPVSLIEVASSFVVAANVNGTMIAAGMPDPLVLGFYFAVSNSEIASLIILPDLSND